MKEKQNETPMKHRWRRRWRWGIQGVSRLHCGVFNLYCDVDVDDNEGKDFDDDNDSDRMGHEYMQTNDVDG